MSELHPLPSTKASSTSSSIAKFDIDEVGLPSKVHAMFELTMRKYHNHIDIRIFL